jgi:hypothetical protein
MRDRLRIGRQLRVLRVWLEQPDEAAPCPPGVRDWLRLGVQDYIDEGIPFDRALGLDVPPGGAHLRPAAALRLAERNLQLVMVLRQLSGGWRAKARKITAAAVGLRDDDPTWAEGLTPEEIQILSDLVRRHPNLPTSPSRLQELGTQVGVRSNPEYVGHPATDGTLPRKLPQESRHAAKKNHRSKT